MTLSQKQRHFTRLVGLFISWAFDHDYEVVGLEWTRTREQQALYVKQGKSRTLRSQHLKRLAIDFALFIDGQYQQSTAAYKPLGEYWEGLDSNNRWGGNWGWDGNHFEYRG